MSLLIVCCFSENIQKEGKVITGYLVMLMSHVLLDISHVLMLISHVFAFLHMLFVISLQVRVKELPRGTLRFLFHRPFRSMFVKPIGCLTVIQRPIKKNIVSLPSQCGFIF